RQASGQPVRGWLSPAKSESANTLALLGEAGLDYVCDWVNDDMPYPMHTPAKTLHAMPHPIDIDDHTILVQNHHTEDDFRDQLCDQFDLLYRESATQGGRVMAISLHPWVIGQPYRIGALEQALKHIMAHRVCGPPPAARFWMPGPQPRPEVAASSRSGAGFGQVVPDVLLLDQPVGQHKAVNEAHALKGRAIQPHPLQGAGAVTTAPWSVQHSSNWLNTLATRW
ncbi:MAG: hypothetical protein EBQ71_16165, partial [Betaproteobacteria bacterium]|nr:hypothetical protein [Betaproteobacteria bacterium]